MKYSILFFFKSMKGTKITELATFRPLRRLRLTSYSSFNFRHLGFTFLKAKWLKFSLQIYDRAHWFFPNCTRNDTTTYNKSSRQTLFGDSFHIFCILTTTDLWRHQLKWAVSSPCTIRLHRRWRYYFDTYFQPKSENITSVEKDSKF